MADPMIRRTIERMVKRQGNQTDALARGLWAWFEQLSSGNETFDAEQVDRRLDNLCDVVVVPEEEDDIS